MSTQQLTNYAVTGSLLLSDGKITQLKNGSEEKPVLVNKKAVLGTKSNFGTTESEVGDGNPHLTEEARLDFDYNQLKVSFSLVIDRTEGYGLASCNVITLHRDIKKMHTKYKEIGGYHFLAEKYAEQIMNGSWLWRNKSGERKISVFQEDTELTFNELAKKIGDGLSGVSRQSFVITAIVKKEYGEQVFPSQEMALNNSDKNDPSRILFKNDKQEAMIHSQKIGNALRTIDCWYPEYNEYEEKIAIEPFGVNRKLFAAFRYKKNSFYSYLKDILVNENNSVIFKELMKANHIDDIKTQDIHYFMAVIIRGGVFGMKEDTTTNKKNKSK